MSCPALSISCSFVRSFPIARQGSPSVCVMAFAMTFSAIRSALRVALCFFFLVLLVSLWVSVCFLFGCCWRMSLIMGGVQAAVCRVSSVCSGPGSLSSGSVRVAAVTPQALSLSARRVERGALPGASGVGAVSGRGNSVCVKAKLPMMCSACALYDPGVHAGRRDHIWKRARSKGASGKLVDIPCSLTVGHPAHHAMELLLGAGVGWSGMSSSISMSLSGAALSR